jgi:proteasome accessory factor A
MDRLTPLLGIQNLSWTQLPAFAAARSEMFEMDAKFSSLGDDGLFNVLDRAGALRHRVRELDVNGAVLHPPQDTRARIRGEVVRRLSAAGVVYGAEWTRIYEKDGLQLDLSDPFETEERWGKVSVPESRRGCFT